MKTEEIKIGETYNVRVRVVKNNYGDTFEIATVTVDENGKEINGEIVYYNYADASSFSPITPENGKKNTEAVPKYDPCRPFKAGDIVEPCSVNGRWCSHGWEDRSGIHYEVVKDEDPLTGYIEVKGPDSPHPFLGHAAFFKLFTPVEEIVPYSVRHNDAHAAYSIYGPYGLSAANFFYGDRYPYSKHSAEAAALAECDRLKAAYRKERENDRNYTD